MAEKNESQSASPAMNQQSIAAFAAAFAGLMNTAVMQQRAAEAAALGDRRLDETVPGGLYKGADGRFHDSFGREVDEEGQLVGDSPRLVVPAGMRPPQGSAVFLGTPEELDGIKEGRFAAKAADREPGTGYINEHEGPRRAPGFGPGDERTPRRFEGAAPVSSSGKALPANAEGADLTDEQRATFALRGVQLPPREGEEQQPQPRGGGSDPKDFESMKTDELDEELSKRNITSVRGTGDGGRVLKEDKIKALRKYEAGQRV